MPLNVDILYLRAQPTLRPVLSSVRRAPGDEGLAGALLAAGDNNTTGRFLDQHYRIESFQSAEGTALVDAALAWVAGGGELIVADLPGEQLRALAAHEELARVLVINAGSRDDTLRREHCRAYLLHTAPSRAMLADALAQHAAVRRWRTWLLVRGDYPEDRAFASALQRAAQRFGLRISDTRTWTFATDQRRFAALEVPLFTQADDYDVTLVADEAGDFGEYFPYNTWLPRPVAGTQGLTPTTWHWSLEQWGATQLQNRFVAAAGRDMTALDYAAWLAVRAIGEAVTRTGETGAAKLYPFLLSDDFQLSAFKGRRLSFRSWNGQLRQPILLVQPNARVAEAPAEEFLHPVTALDSLGYDAPEVTCSMARG